MRGSGGACPWSTSPYVAGPFSDYAAWVLRSTVSVILLALGATATASAQDFHHPVPWVPEAELACVVAPTSMTRAALDAELVAVRAGDAHVTALELIASCAVPRRSIAEAFVEGGLVRHRASDFTASRAAFAQALIADPSHLAARFDYACALARTGARAAAVAEIGELARAGERARRWLARVATDPDLESVRDDEDVRSFVALQSSLWQPAAIAAPAGIPVPAPVGPVWEPIEARAWAPFRELLVASGLFGDRRGFRAAEAATFTHASLAALPTFTGPAFWRPERGEVFLVVPFAIPGPNHRDGIAVLHWNGSAFERSCHEYCQFLSDVQTHELRVRPADDRLQIVRCRDGSTRCTSFVIEAQGRVARHRMTSLLDGVVPTP